MQSLPLISETKTKLLTSTQDQIHSPLLIKSQVFIGWMLKEPFMDITGLLKLKRLVSKVKPMIRNGMLRKLLLILALLLLQWAKLDMIWSKKSWQLALLIVFASIIINLKFIFANARLLI